MLSANRTEVGLKLACARRASPPPYGANRTKVGLKRGYYLEGNFNDFVSANRTKVGLKPSFVPRPAGPPGRANRTKVGLKHVTSNAGARPALEVLIEPRWD